MRALFTAAALALVALSGCLSTEPTETATPGEETAASQGLFAYYNLPAEFGEPTPVSPRELQGGNRIGLYEPTIDVGPEGNIYVSSHSADVGVYPSPAYFSVDDGQTWASMALFMDQQGDPDEHMSAPLFSDEVFIIAGEEGEAWGADCCTNDNAFPLVGWCADGAEVCWYNQNAHDESRIPVDAALSGGDCVPAPTTDRPWIAYNNGKLLMVNNPGFAPRSPNGQIPLQVGVVDVPPLVPVAYTGAAWQTQWNFCGSTGGFIPGIPDMRPDHFFAAPQWIDFRNDGCPAVSHYDVITGNANDIYNLQQTTVFENSHVAPAESDSTPSTIGRYGQAVFDATGGLFVGAMNNSAIMIDGDCTAHPTDGGIHLAYSNDDAQTFTETTFRFDRPVSSIYMDGNRHGEGFLLNWGEIDDNRTDWFLAHVFANADGTLRMENKMLAVDNGPEASRHVQGAALGPDGRAYMVYSDNSQNPGASDRAEVGDTPLWVAVQVDGARMPVE